MPGERLPVRSASPRNAELAQRVGISPSPCLRRVRRLERTGVIRGSQAVIDPAAIGRSLCVLVGVRLVRHARTDVVAFERAVIKLPEVRYTYHVANAAGVVGPGLLMP